MRQGNHPISSEVAPEVLETAHADLRWVFPRDDLDFFWDIAEFRTEAKPYA